MAHKIPVTVLDANQERFSGDCEVVVVPGKGGIMAIEAGHTRLMTPLRKGTIKLKTAPEKVTDIEVEKGFLWVTKKGAKILI